MTKLESFVQTLRQGKTSDLVSYLCTGHDMLNHSVIDRVVTDAYGKPGEYATRDGHVIRKLSPAEENDVRTAITAIAAEIDRRIPAEGTPSKYAAESRA